jgi:TonB family protein
MLEVWKASEFDLPRLRRLVVGACLGAAMLGALGFGATRVAKAPPPPPPEEEEPEIPVSLVETPEDKPEEPARDVDQAPAAPGPRRAPPSQTPTQIPHGAKQADAGDDLYGNAPPDVGTAGGGAGSGGGSGHAPKAAPPPPPPPPPPPKPKLSPEDYDAPKCKLAAPDRGQARAIGVEGTVVVKYTVTESGVIANPRVVKGPPELAGLALAAIAASHCEPARLKSDGSPVTVTRTVRYPIRFSSN